MPAPDDPSTMPGPARGDAGRMRIAIVGAGMAFAPYLASLLELAGRVEVAWLVGNSLERISRAALQLPGARVTTRLADVLGDPGVSAAFVLSPPFSHFDVVSQLAAAGKHVLLEKPLEVDAAKSAQVVAACQAAGVRLAVMLQHRLRPASLAMHGLVASGALGEMTCASVDMRWWRPQSYYDEPGRGTRARDGGGVLLTQGIHTLDNFLHIAGEPRDVVAFANTSAAHRMECEDVVAGALRYDNGATAVINATVAAYPGFAERIDYSGTLGTATLSGGRLDVHYIDGRQQSVGQAQMLGGGADPMAFTHHAHQAVIEDFLDAVRQARPPRTDGRSVLPVQRLIDALLESASQGRIVALAPA